MEYYEIMKIKTECSSEIYLRWSGLELVHHSLVYRIPLKTDRCSNFQVSVFLFVEEKREKNAFLCPKSGKVGYGALFISKFMV